MVAQMIGSFKVVIEPHKSHMGENTLIVDTVKVFNESGSTNIVKTSDIHAFTP